MARSRNSMICPRYNENINNDPSFGGKPGLSVTDTDYIVAFLETLADGFIPSSVAAKR